MKTSTAKDILDGMTRDELLVIADHLKVPFGKTKDNLVTNISNAISAGKACITGTLRIQMGSDIIATQTLALRKVCTSAGDTTLFLKLTKTPVKAGFFHMPREKSSA